MFEQLRRKVAVRHSLVLGIILVILLTLIFSYNLTKMYSNIESALNDLSDGRYNFFTSSDDENVDSDRNTLVILVSGDSYFLSNIGFYDNDTLTQLINGVMNGQRRQESGTYKINGNYIAFKTADSFMNAGVFIFVYDYTSDFIYFRNMMVIILITGVIGMIIITLFSFMWAKRTVAPIEDAFEKHQELVANASHELKTPLTIINTDLSILNSSRESMSDEQAKWLDSINKQVGKMSALITEMLELARIESKTEKNEFLHFNFSEAAERVVLEVEALAYENKITFNTEIKENVFINAQPAMIEKLVYILMENALKYTPYGGEVAVKLYSDRKKAVLKIRNTGDGIERENIPKLFDRFYRTDEAHTSSNSFGLGLAIAKSIVDVNEGTIGVDSKVGEYTEFIVIFRQAS